MTRHFSPGKKVTHWPKPKQPVYVSKSRSKP